MEQNNDEYPIRIAQIMGKMNNGGVEAVVMNYYRNIDRKKIQFDFIVDNDSTCPQKAEIESLGGQVIFVPPYSKIKEYAKMLKKIFLNNKYKIVHSHITTLNVFPLRIAKKCGIPVRISHAHSTSGKGEFVRNLIKYTLRPFSKIYATHYFACSEYAGKWLYGKKSYKKGQIYVLNNAIDVEKFKFDSDTRNEIRKRLNVGDGCILVGHIGRFVMQKNHLFLLEIFNSIYKKNKNVKLLLIGNGPMMASVKKRISEYELGNSVIILESTEEAYKYYNAMDIFMLPSIYEGLPVVGVEAQCNGLICYFSDKITKEVFLLESSKFFKLDVKKWVESFMNENIKRTEYEIKNTYNIYYEAKILEKIYLNLVGVI